MTTTPSLWSPLQNPRWFSNLLAGLLLLLYGPLLIYWCNGWLNHNISLEHEYFSHGVLGLPLATKLLWEKRQHWSALEDRWHPLGGVCLGVAATFYLSGITDTVNLSLPLTLIGLCLWLKGIPGLRLQLFPLLLLLFATPTNLPYLVEPYSLGLQKFVASVAAFILMQFHFEFTLQGIYIFVGERVVEVAPHCAGLKALFSNLYFCMIGLYWTGSWKPWSKALVLVGGTIGISVFSNVLRNTILTVFHGMKQDALFDWFHEGWGSQLYWAFLIGLLFLLFYGVQKVWPNSPSSPIDSAIDSPINSAMVDSTTTDSSIN
jgi:cyanoexosortase B